VRSRAAAIAALNRIRADQDRAAQAKSITPAAKVDVSGSAKVEVDFNNMPRGAKAKANGAGSLKDISVTQTPQMQSADESLQPPG
jgi:hypothetical protein